MTVSMTQAVETRYATIDDASEISSLLRQTIQISNAQDYPAIAIDRVLENLSPENVCQLIDG